MLTWGTFELQFEFQQYAIVTILNYSLKVVALKNYPRFQQVGLFLSEPFRNFNELSLSLSLTLSLSLSHTHTHTHTHTQNLKVGLKLNFSDLYFFVL